MPPRTNAYQELVALIERAFSKPGDVIKSSAMEAGIGLKTFREIDILRTTGDGSHAIRVAVEVKDEAKPLDIQVIDAYSGKYYGPSRVPVDRVVVVARNGFTSGAKEKAHADGIVLVTLDEAKELDWSRIEDYFARLREQSTMRFNWDPHLHYVEAIPPFPTNIAKRIQREGVLRCPTCRPPKHHGTLWHCVSSVALTKNHPLGRQLLAGLEEKCKSEPDGNAHTIAEVPLSEGTYIVFEGKKFYPKKLRFEVHAAINSQVPCTFKTYRSSSTESGDQLVHHLAAEMPGFHFEAILPGGPHRPDQISMKLVPKIRPNAKERADKRKKDKRAGKKRN